MTQAPITVTYSLEEVLGQIQQQLVQLNNKIDQQSQKSDEQFKKVDEQFKKVDEQFKKVDEQFKKVDEQFKKVDEQFKKVDEQLQTMRQDITAEITAVKIHVIQSDADLKREMEGLKAEVRGIGKRLDTQEFINRSVVVGFVLAIVAGIVKLFLPTFPPS